MLYFALLATLTFHLWGSSSRTFENTGATSQSALPWAFAAAILVYLQILSGALMRHLGAGLACMDMPFCQGSLWSGSMPLLQKIHMIHRIGSVLTATVVTVSSWKIFRSVRTAQLRVLTALAPFLVLLQIGLGFLSVYLTLNIFSVTAHLGLGALIWLTWVLIILKLRRDARTAPARDPLPLVSPALHHSPSQ